MTNVMLNVNATILKQGINIKINNININSFESDAEVITESLQDLERLLKQEHEADTVNVSIETLYIEGHRVPRINLDEDHLLEEFIIVYELFEEYGAIVTKLLVYDDLSTVEDILQNSTLGVYNSRKDFAKEVINKHLTDLELIYLDLENYLKAYCKRNYIVEETFMENGSNKYYYYNN